MPFLEGIPTVTVHLDKPRELAFTMGAMRRVQDRLGTLEFKPDDPGAALVVPAYIWACMDSEGRREISVEDLEDMIHPGNLAAITEAVGRLFKASSPEAAADAPAGPTEAGPQLASG